MNTDSRWVWAMNWMTPLFIHWPIDLELLRPHVPPALEIDTFDGEAWLTLLPFQMVGSRLRYTPRLPWLSNFLELNLRTYVTAGGKHGVWVLSVEVSNLIVARGTRLFFDMPFYHAKMFCTQAAGEWRYSSQRAQPGALPAEFVAAYRPVGATKTAEPETLDHWLTERYCAFAVDRNGRILRSDIHHEAWLLQQAEVEIQKNTILDALGLSVAQMTPHCHYSPGVKVVAWPPKSL